SPPPRGPAAASSAGRRPVRRGRAPPAAAHPLPPSPPAPAPSPPTTPRARPLPRPQPLAPVHAQRAERIGLRHQLQRPAGELGAASEALQRGLAGVAGGDQGLGVVLLEPAGLVQSE